MGIITEKEDILDLLHRVEKGELSPEQAADMLRTKPFSDLGYAKVDYHRSIRQGIGEVIFGSGKANEHIAGILIDMQKNGSRNVLVTRISREAADHIESMNIPMIYHPIPKLGIALPGEERPKVGSIVIAAAGTADMAVCEEAALLTAENLGNMVTRLYDVGVAGLQRILSKLEVLNSARCVIVVAGMEGALASVVGGLVSCPIIAVPTSIGYGANFGGLSALLTMLNSCAAGVGVVNIDNGFGAAFLASRINQMEGIK
ncbi:MAG: nickel pincer cofactor biosynthesis protein LarB [Treponema sp.]|nr:nickel pincer cofactor biosynthesis protein LarB [Treponema sp.]